MIRPATDLPPGLAQSAPQTRAPGALGQQDFLTLLTTQMRNQDPLNPMQNTEFLGQMAQFSTVAGIDRLDDSLQALGGSFRDMRLGMASQLVGQMVLVPGTLAQPDRSGAYRGAVTLDDPADRLDITFSDPQSGAILHRETLGAQPAGDVSFGWNTPPAELRSTRQPLRVAVTAFQDGQPDTTSPISVYARVESASLGSASDDITFTIEGYGKMHSLEIESIR